MKKNMTKGTGVTVKGYFAYENGEIRFVTSGTFDSRELYALIRKAAGKISDLKFEEMCGIKHPGLYDVKNGKRKTPLRHEEIEAIARYADPESGVTLADLEYANDMVAYTGSPDTNEIRRLVDLARGDEPLGTFANRLGLTKATLYDRHRIKTKPFEIDFVLKVAGNAVEGSGVTLKSLLRANYAGKKIPKRVYVEPTHKGMSWDEMTAMVENRKTAALARETASPFVPTRVENLSIPAFSENAVLTLMSVARRMSEREFESLRNDFGSISKNAALMQILAASGTGNETTSVTLAAKDASEIAERMILGKYARS